MVPFHDRGPSVLEHVHYLPPGFRHGSGRGMSVRSRSGFLGAWLTQTHMSELTQYHDWTKNLRHVVKRGEMFCKR